jgi:hypothetical protein
MVGHTTGLAQAQLETVNAPARSDGPDPAIAEAQALPPTRYPRLREIADAATRTTALQELNAGLGVILAGLERDSDD